MAKRSDQFQTIRTEGALLPPDILQSVGSLKVDGVSPTSYHLPPGTKLNEAIAHSWSVLQKYWKGFQEARQPLDPDKTGTEITNQHWLLPLFEELKYGRLTTVKSPEIDGRTYPIERFYADQPIHLIGCNLPLDRRTTGARGAATASPHSMMQEYLNRTEESLWGFLSNGLVLRVLRDNVSLSRQAYIEFDLEAMMEGEVYADFALLWMICHQSRIEAEKPQDFWLEKWSQLARDLGTRVLSDLRTGVTNAIAALGRGFIAHPKNDRLRGKLQSGELSTQDYYRQLLRIVYRLLFLFVAEDRELLHPTDADDNACDLYDTYYSTRRLRELADQIRGSKHADLWQTLSLVFDALSRAEGCPELGLAPLGSFLWLRSSTAELLAPASKGNESVEDPSLITNDELLSAVRALAYVVQDKVRRAVDYRNLGSEELGSVYESLLELHPLVNVPARTFELSIAAGNERKTTGSYYTPDSLVQCLLDSALDPVVEDRLKGKKGKDAESAILDIKVCDPACGSGHFLIAAAHRLARHLARVRTGESEPSPADYQHALRDVIGHCIYGVDLNPMAVELCKVSLWMEAIEPGRPLSFLEHHIQCGNSLLGTTPALLTRGIPDDAFKPIEGDDRAFCAQLKKSNRKERAAYEKRLSEESTQGYTSIKYSYDTTKVSARFAQLNAAPDTHVDDIAKKEDLYRAIIENQEYSQIRLLADTWCSVFVWPKADTEIGRTCPTEAAFRQFLGDPNSISERVESQVEKLRNQYQFFYWHLAFPDVFRLPDKGSAVENEQTGCNGGFDVVLGNPPWERVKLQEKEWFAGRRDDIAEASSAAKRRALIANLAEEEPELFKKFTDDVRVAESISHFLRASNRFPLCSRGDVNTFAVFAELNRDLLNIGGHCGCVLPPGIATDDTYKLFIQDIVERKSLRAFFAFTNRGYTFPGVESTLSFSLFVIANIEIQTFQIAAKLWSVDQLKDADRIYSLTPDEIRVINPNTQNLPIFETAQDAELVKALQSRLPVLINESKSQNIWDVKLSSMFHMSNDSGDFKSLEPMIDDGYELVANRLVNGGASLLPLYESKLIGQFDHRHATFREIPRSDRFKTRARTNSPTEGDLENPDYAILPRYWIAEDLVDQNSSEQWHIGFRNAISAVADSRSLVASVVPKSGIGNSLPLIQTDVNSRRASTFLLGYLNSFIADYLIRQKASGGNLNFYIMKQLPVTTPSALDLIPAWNAASRLDVWIHARVLELTYTAWDLEAFALDCGYDGPPFRCNEARRFPLRCELDAAYFHLYLGTAAEWGIESSQLRKMFPTPRDAVEYIMETFPIVKRRDIKRTEVTDDAGEVTQPGTYITKDTILSIYDEMATAIETGQPYQTRLDPPPGPPTDAQSNFIPMAQWNEANWPEHVHESKNVTAK